MRSSRATGRPSLAEGRVPGRGRTPSDVAHVLPLRRADRRGHHRRPRPRSQRDGIAVDETVDDALDDDATDAVTVVTVEAEPPRRAGRRRGRRRRRQDPAAPAAAAARPPIVARAAAPTRCACTSRRSARSAAHRPRTSASWPSASRPACTAAGAPGQRRRSSCRSRAPQPAGASCSDGDDGPGAAHPGQPAPGGVDRQALRRPGHAAPRPHPGGQPRPDAGGREVRLHEGLQVLDLRHVVDPPGHHPGHRRPGPHHPHPGAHGRDHEPGAAHPAPDAAGARARADGRRARRARSS